MMIRKGLSILLVAAVLLSISLPVFSDEVTVISIGSKKENDFKLPINLTGGYPLSVKYDKNLNVYEDPSIRVTRDTVRSSEWQCTYYPCFITIKDPSQLRTLPADETFGSRMIALASQMAKRVNAVLALNGDYCTAMDTTKATSYILRQGVVYRDSVQDGLDLLLVDEDGDFHIFQADPALASMDKTTVDGKKVINAFQFGPGLVIDGQPVDDAYIVNKEHSPAFANPGDSEQRMCIGQIDELHYIVVACAFHGITLPRLRDLVMSIAPVKNLYVLDGGNSTQLVFLGTKFNNLQEGGQNIRGVTDIIYFASSWNPDAK